MSGAEAKPDPEVTEAMVERLEEVVRLCELAGKLRSCSNDRDLNFSDPTVERFRLVAERVGHHGGDILHEVAEELEVGR